MPFGLGRAFLVAVLLCTAGCSRNDDASDASSSARSGGGGGGRGGPQKQVVEVTAATRRDLVESVSVVGSLAANESAELRPEIAGLVRTILFDEGQQVKKGDVLLKIDDSELRAQFAQVEARFNLAQLNVARSDNLSETKTISQSEADRARADFAAAKAELALLRTRLEKTEVKAPFDGVVGGRTVSPGDYVNTTTPITKIDDLSRMKVEFQLPERYLGNVNVGTPFKLESRALNLTDDVRGEVYFVSATIDRNTRSTEVKGHVADPPAVLRPGMFTNVRIQLNVRRGTLTVPEGAILTSASGPQVIAVREVQGENVAEFVPVALGMRVGGVVEVAPLKGELTEGQNVVASGVGALVLFPGAKLEIRPLRPEFQSAL